MYTFEVWFKIGDYRTAKSQLQAGDWHQAKLIAESMYGSGNILNISMLS